MTFVAPEKDRPFRIAIIGISGYGRTHLGMAFSETLKGKAVLVAAVVINPEEEPILVDALQGMGVHIYGDVDTLFSREAGNIDICLIPTAPHYHAEMAEKALRNGCHVLVEKPLTCSVEEANSIIKASSKYRRKCVVGFQDMVAPEIHMVKRWIMEGRIGSPISINGLGLWPRPKSYYSRNDWAGRLHVNGRKVLDSPVSNAFAHFINLVLFWGGGRMEEFAHAEQFEADLFRAQAIESFDTFFIRGKLSSGIPFNVLGTHSCRESFGPEIRISGNLGTIRWHFKDGIRLELLSGENESIPSTDLFLCRMRVMEEFMSLLEDRESTICLADQAMAHTQLVEDLSVSNGIEDVHPDRVCSVTDLEGEEQVYISGIEQLMLKIHKNEVSTCVVDDLRAPTTADTLS